MFLLYDTMKRKKVEFETLEEGVVRLYACGPTVYDFPHIGNLRTFLFGDVLCRHLRRLGYEVRNVMNITDVDDKTIREAAAQGITLAEYTQFYTDKFLEDLEALRIQPAWKYPRATEHIQEMQDLVAALMENGHAYVHEGSVYFDISSFSRYGMLSGIVPDADSSREYGRLDADEYEREDVRDFVLWKVAKEGDPAEASWDSPWGAGRPGWHIECSAMSTKYLGNTLDIHVGGVDLIFPHHENEIAQSEGATGEQFVRYWVHPEHLIVEGEKMSKSLGNFFTLRDLMEQGYNPVAIRHQLMTAHYRRQLNFTLEGLEQSQQTLNRLWDFVDRLEEMPEDAEGEDLSEQVAAARSKFDEALNDDVNVPGAMAAVFELMREVNILMGAGKVGSEGAAQVLGFFEDADTVLGIIEHEKGAVEEEIEALIAERDEARASKDFARADEIRDQLAAQGIVLEDSASGTRWRKVE